MGIVRVNQFKEEFDGQMAIVNQVGIVRVNQVDGQVRVNQQVEDLG